MAMLPVNRIPEILKRMESNLNQAEAMKTCFGILAIMSRDDANKTIIAKDGMETMLNAMTAHIDRTDVQEAGCDLLWSLAFNSSVVKEHIAKCNGAVVLVRALKRHTRSPDFLKSACGALSNICQFKLNQEAVAAQGGLQPLVGSIHIHQTNAKLLPFIFDAIASIIVNNEDNAKTVSSLGIIPVGVATLSRHKQSREVVKSGCHTLAILSDVKGQASKIAFAGGVPIILALLDIHPLYSDLHRVAAVVLLRMLQESSQVGREICSHEGVRILLFSLEKGGAQQDTVAAVTHILYSITNPNSPAASSVEAQLWLKQQFESSQLTSRATADSHETIAKTTALVGVVTILGQYSQRRDVVRAACRLITNLSHYNNVLQALDCHNVLEKILDCISVHKDTKDVLEAASVILKAISRWRKPKLRSPTANTIQGFLHLFESRINDEEVVAACGEICKAMLEEDIRSQARSANNNNDHKAATDGQEPWYMHAVSNCLLALNIYGSFITKLNEEKTSGKILGASSEHARVLNSLGEFLMLCLSSEHLSLNDDRVEEVLSFLQNWNQGNPPERMSILVYIEEKLRKRTTSHPTNTQDGENNSISGKRSPAVTSTIGSDINAHNKAIDAEEQSTSLKTSQSTRAISRVTSQSNVSTALPPGGIQCHDSNPSMDRQHNHHHSHNSLHQNHDTADIDQELARNMSHEVVISQAGKLLPLHPLKDPHINRLGQRQTKLLENWPNFLERLLPNHMDSRYNAMQDRDIPNRMHLCYESIKPGGKSIISRCPTPIPYHVPTGGLGPAFGHSLTFDSEFESGNLFRAIQVGDATYDLLLRADVHTQGHTQWFYFAVSNTHPPELVRLAEQGVQVPPVRVCFNLINFTKPDSLFNLGMRPVVYSAYDAKTKGTGWVRAGTDISYYGNNFVRNNSSGEGSASYFTLTFTMEFHHPKDTMLIAYSYPYTLTDYKHHIQQILDRPRSDSFIRRFKLCSTLAGEDCDLVVITEFSDGREKIGPLTFTEAEYQSCDENAASTSSGGTPQVKLKAKELKALEKQRQALKPALFLSARVHPGETPASWMMKGIMEFLTSDSPAAQQIRKLYVVFIIPILNPDGVNFGNNRCSLAGVDLNRQWKLPVRHLHPTVFYFKMFMLAQKKIREVSMFVDLHGHSRKYNVFMYGCDDKKKPKPQVRAFPKFLSNHHIGGKYVCFNDCSFHVKKGRESTARVVASKEMNIPCSFTLEATFCGSNYGPLKNCHMNIGHMQEVGAALCDAFLNFAISEGFGKECLALASSSKNYLSTYAVESGGSAMTSMMADLASSSSASHIQHQQQPQHHAAQVGHHPKRRGTNSSYASGSIAFAGDDSVATGNTGDDITSILGGDDRSSRRSSTALGLATVGGGDENETGAEAAGQNPNIVESDSEDSDNDESRTPPVNTSKDHSQHHTLTHNHNIAGNQLEIGGFGHNVRHYVPPSSASSANHSDNLSILKNGVAATGHALLMNQHHHFPPHTNPNTASNLTSIVASNIASANQVRTISDNSSYSSHRIHYHSNGSMTGLSMTKGAKTDIIPLSGLASITTSAPNSANGGINSARSTTALSESGHQNGNGGGLIHSSRSNPSPHHHYGNSGNNSGNNNSTGSNHNSSSHHHPPRLLSSSMNQANISLVGSNNGSNPTTPVPSGGSNTNSLLSLKSSGNIATSNSARDYIGMDGEDKGLDRVMELMYASNYRDSAKLRAVDGLSSAGGGRAGKGGSSSGRSGLAASAFELTGNRYHQLGNNNNVNAGGRASPSVLLSGQHHHHQGGGNVPPIPVGSSSNSPRPNLEGSSPSSLALAGSSGLGTRYQRSLTLDNAGIQYATTAINTVTSNFRNANNHSNGDNSSSTTLPKLNLR